MISKKINPCDHMFLHINIVNKAVNNFVNKLEKTVDNKWSFIYSQLFPTYSQEYSQNQLINWSRKMGTI